MAEVFYYDASQRCLSFEPEGGFFVRHSDYAALEAQLAERVKVKPLEWRKDGGALIARSPVGVTYEITSFDILFIDGKQSGRFWGDTEAAKAAAQADYERRILSALEVTPPAPKVTATHRHKKRGSCYVLIGVGKMQAGEWYDGSDISGDTHVDMREVAIYRSVDDGSLWVRPREEFEDGRFEALTAAQDEED